ncbi:MAG TPA: CHAT domain-containing protein, partial [Chitinophagaceae bacterium]|nr:CHAT domain-containing protein [Chitinophagaceae bacterium]
MAKKAILAYANDQENSLKWLADEFKTISDYFRDNNTGEVDIIPLPDATLDDIRSVLQNPKVADDIILFHFSGHADPGKLFFHHEQGGRADGIAGMLSVIPSLQFVFLNGCATRDQVAALHAAGVKAVIATSRAVNDAQAAKLSKTFYASLCRHMPLGKSFDKAKGYTAAESDFTRFLPQASRSLGLDEAEGTDVPWGIYYHPELDPAGRQDVEDWIFPEHGIVAEVNVPYQPCYDFIEQIARKAGSYFAHLDEKSLNDLDKNVRAEITDLYQYYTDTYNRE